MYEEHAGESIHFIAEVGFDDHIVEVRGFRPVKLSRIIIDFGENMVIPNLHTKFSELTTAPDQSKIIVHEQGQGKNATVNLVYEDAGKLPPKLQLHTESVINAMCKFFR